MLPRYVGGLVYAWLCEGVYADRQFHYKCVSLGTASEARPVAY